MPSKWELKSLGERRNYKDRELDARAVANLSSDEYLWFQTFYPVRLETAAQIESNRRQNAERMPVWETRRMWRGEVSPEEDAKARAAGDAFAKRHPTFERTTPNAMLMIEYMKSHDLDATEVFSYVKAFNALVEEGKLIPAKAQSADEYLAEHADELVDRRIPPLIAARHQREQTTAAHFAKSAAVTNEGSVTRVVDYPQERRGVPPQPDRVSFRKKIAAMSAEAVLRECEIDPAFRKALDELT